MTSDKFESAMVVSPFEYDRYKAEGRDMRFYIKNRPIPTSGTNYSTFVPGGYRRVVDWLGREHKPLPGLP